MIQEAPPRVGERHARRRAQKELRARAVLQLLIALVTADCEIVSWIAACEIWPISAVATKYLSCLRVRAMVDEKADGHAINIITTVPRP